MPDNVPGHKETTASHLFIQHTDAAPRAGFEGMPGRGSQTSVSTGTPPTPFLLDMQIHRLCPESSSLTTDLGLCTFNKHCETDLSLGEGEGEV